MATDYAQIHWLLQPFENCCAVTEDVRHGVAVDVSVRDANGTVLRTTSSA